jgi:energy-coupling factor transporter ATP-binding protein EcfA2
VHAVQLVGQQAVALRAAATSIIAILSQHQLEETDRLFLRKEKQVEDAAEIITATNEALNILRDAGLQHIVTLLGNSGQGKTTLINAVLAAAQASAHEYSTCGEQRADCVDLFTAAAPAMKRHLQGPSAGSIIDSSSSNTPEAAAALFFKYSHAVLQVIERSMHEATADLLGINKEDLLGARSAVKKMQELQADLAAEAVTQTDYDTEYTKLFHKLEALAAKATATVASDQVSIEFATEQWLKSEPTKQALEAAKAQRDPFIEQLQDFAVKARVPKEPFLLVTPPPSNGGLNACTFLNTEVNKLLFKASLFTPVQRFVCSCAGSTCSSVHACSRSAHCTSTMECLYR